MDFSEVYGNSVSIVSMAARCGSVREVRRQIRSGRSVDIRDNRGWTSLHEAAARGSRGAVREILSAASDVCDDFLSFVNAQTHEGETACFLAAQHGHLPVVKVLLIANADINKQTNDLSCPLYTAVDRGHRDVVLFLIDRGAEVNRRHTASCWTCLHQAAYKGDDEIVGCLCPVADLESVDDHNITPLFVSAQYGRLQCLQTLISAGANVDAQAADGATPLFIASQEGHDPCVAVLLEALADPNLSGASEWPQLPLHAATQFGHISVLKRLLPVTDRSCDHGEDQVSPLYQAVQGGHTQALQLLLGEGFSPDAQDCDVFRSPLSMAVREHAPSESLKMVEILLSAGATLHKETLMDILHEDKPDLLKVVLDFRTIPGQSPQIWTTGSGPRRDLTAAESRALVRACVVETETALMWMPLLLNAGLEPGLLLQESVFEDAPSSALNYLLQFLNWTCLSPDLRLILDKRRTEKIWDPLPLFDSIPSLFHLCRLTIRRVLGSACLKRTTTLQLLPVPVPLHHFLQFRDIQSNP